MVKSGPLDFLHDIKINTKKFILFDSILVTIISFLKIFILSKIK